MAPVDYFAGVNEGNRNLMAAMDSYGKEERQKGIDVMNAALHKQQIATSEFALSEAKDKATRNRQTLADIKRIFNDTVKTPASITVGGENTIPATVPYDVPLSNASNMNEPSAEGTITSKPAVNYTPQDKHTMMLDAAIKNGDWDTAAKVGQVVDVTSKINAEQRTQLEAWAKNLKAFREAVRNPKAVQEFAASSAATYGVDPKLVNGIDFTTSGDIIKPDGQGGTISIIEMPDGTWKEVHASAKTKEPTNTTNNWIEESQEKGPDGKPTPKAIQAQANLDKAGELTAGKRTKMPYVTKNGTIVPIDLNNEDDAARVAKEGLKPVPLEAAEKRVEAFGKTINSATGVIFDKPSGKTYMNVDSGKGDGSTIRMELNSEQVRQLGLQTKEETPTARTKTMQQLAPKVEERALVAKKAIESEINNLGPLDSRTREIWAKKIGGSDPQYTAIRTNSDLLATLLANMHVGASGAEKTIERFADMLNVKNQSPDNLLASIDAIIAYAKAAKNPQIQKMPNIDELYKPKTGGAIKYTSNGKNYNIPADKEAAFLKDNPNAQKVK